MACRACIEPRGRFVVSRQAITPARWCGLMTVGMMADRSSVSGLTREYLPDWSFSRMFCIDFDIPSNSNGLESPRWRCTTLLNYAKTT